MARVTPNKKSASKNNSKKSTAAATPTKQKPTKGANPKEVSKDRIVRAITELTKFAGKEEEDKKTLIDDEELTKSLNLIVVNNKSFSGSAKSFKLKLVNINHSIYKPWKEASVTSVKDFKTLLILKDSDKKAITADELHDSLNESDITVDEIITGSDLKTTHKAFEARRAFISEFSLILADDNIITTLPKLLGGKAYTKLETTPIPVRSHSSNKTFSKTTLVNSIKKIYLNQLPIKLPRGTTMNVHLGNLEWFKADELAENVESVVKNLVDTYSIRSIYIKSNQSPNLPLYYNDDVLAELTSTAKEVTKHKKESVKIDGVDVELSNFDKALLEIANPKELSTVFAKSLKNAKRQRGDDAEVKTQSKKTKK